MMSNHSAPDDAPHRMAPEAWQKLDAALRTAVRDAGASDDVAFPVLVLLSAPAAGAPAAGERPAKEERRRQAAERERLFRDETTELVRAVERAGARDVAPRWINRTVAMVAPRAALEAAGRRPEVRAIVRSTTHHAIPE